MAQILIVPPEFGPRTEFGATSIHRILIRDAEALAARGHKVRVLQSSGWQFPADRPYGVVPYQGESERSKLLSPERYAAIEKSITNQTLLLMYDPLVMLQLGMASFNPDYGRRYRFPKPVLRFLSNVQEWQGDAAVRKAFALAIQAYPVLWNSPQARTDARVLLRKEGIYRFDDSRWHLVPLSIDTDAIDAARERMQPRAEVFTVRAPWNRWTDQKQPELYREVARKVTAATQARFQIPLTTANLSTTAEKRLDDLRADPALDLLLDHHEPGDREGYFRSLGEPHAFLSTSKYESFGLTQLEYLYAGMVGVYLDVGGYSREILPDYPFVATREDLASTLLAIAADVERAQDLVRSYRALIRERYARDVEAKALSRAMDVLDATYARNAPLT